MFSATFRAKDDDDDAPVCVEFRYIDTECWISALTEALAEEDRLKGYELIEISALRGKMIGGSAKLKKVGEI